MKKKLAPSTPNTSTPKDVRNYLKVLKSKPRNRKKRITFVTSTMRPVPKTKDSYERY
jgi:hypothetical protein